MNKNLRLLRLIGASILRVPLETHEYEELQHRRILDLWLLHTFADVFQDTNPFINSSSTSYVPPGLAQAV